MVFEDVKDLKHLPPMHAVGDDMLTGVDLIGKATLRMMYCGEAEVYLQKSCIAVRDNRMAMQLILFCP